MKKRIFSVFLALVMAFSLLPTVALAKGDVYLTVYVTEESCRGSDSGMPYEYAPQKIQLTGKTWIYLSDKATPASGSEEMDYDIVAVTSAVEPAQLPSKHAYFDGDATLTLYDGFTLSGNHQMTTNYSESITNDYRNGTDRYINSGDTVSSSYGLEWTGNKTLIVRFGGNSASQIIGGLDSDGVRLPAINASGNIKFEPLDGTALLRLLSTDGEIIKTENGATVDFSAVGVFSDDYCTSPIAPDSILTASAATMKQHGTEAVCQGTGCAWCDGRLLGQCQDQ